jgi:glyoxylase-like metal-dependent hydrolase (beta-lactamase superfamily II)
VLFGQDIHGPFNKAFGSDIDLWKESMHKLLALEADILCEGHFGIYQPKEKVRDYIERYLEEYD